jgi:hypothetical protein
MRSFFKRICATAIGLAGALLLVPSESQAMPSFARQTGMNCNSCHIGTDNVPNFTRTGRLFAMRGYVRPTVRERLRHDSEMVEDNPQYGGDYLALNWDDFFAARLVSELVQGGKNNDGSKRDVTSRPAARMAFFYTGPITDWIGLWTEIGYLGNNAINSVTTGNTGPTGLNFYAYDEYRLSTGMDIAPDRSSACRSATSIRTWSPSGCSRRACPTCGATARVAPAARRRSWHSASMASSWTATGRRSRS